MNRIETYVVPWDFSEHSKAALQYAIHRFPGQEIKVVCVLERPNPYSPGVEFGTNVERKAAKECEMKFYETVGLEKSCSISFHVRFGEPAAQICHFVDETKPDYLVISTHGRSGINKLILGSVAQCVISNTRFPVIVLSSQWFDHQAKSRPVTCDKSV